MHDCLAEQMRAFWWVQRTSARLSVAVYSTTVYGVAKRFRARGEWALWDEREDNSEAKLSDRLLNMSHSVVSGTPAQRSWRQSNWTRKLPVLTLARLTGVRIRVMTIKRALAVLQSRRRRSRSVVASLLARAVKTNWPNAIQHFLAIRPKKDATVYEHEVDIQLNPKIHWD